MMQSEMMHILLSEFPVGWRLEENFPYPGRSQKGIFLRACSKEMHVFDYSNLHKVGASRFSYAITNMTNSQCCTLSPIY